jgi:lysophospholipase
VAATELVSIDLNLVPAGATVEMLRTSDGRSLRAAWWRPTAGAARGTACLMQGRAEFIEKYFETIADLRRRGLAVFCFDWRGQGGSERLLADPRKGFVRRYDDYALDLAAALGRMEVLDLPKPFFGVAHSMGATATLIALARGETRLARCLLSAPFVAIHERRAPPGAGALALLLTALGGRRSYIPGGGGTSIMTKPFKHNFLTSDPARYRRTAAILEAASDLGIGDPTVGWIRASYRAFAEMARLDFGFTFRTPLLFVTAGGDTLVSSRAAEALAQRIKGAGLVSIAHARHEIMMERDIYREQFFAALDAFIPGEQAEAAPVASASAV